MRQRRLQIMPTLVAAYRDFGRLLIAMRAIILSAFLILLAISLAEEFVPNDLWEQQLSGEALGLVKDAVWAFLLAPVVIAVHRFVILDEITPAYTLPVGEPVFRVFLGWLLALRVFVGLPFDLLVMLQTLDWSPRASALVFAVALIAAVAVLLRSTILLPALAVEAPGATPSHALADTKGQALRILSVFLLALLPWVAVDIGGVLLLGPSAQITGTPRAMIFLVMGGVLQMIMLSITAEIASYVFMSLGAEVRRAAEPLAPA
jgi:hypothetical protein